MISVQDFQLDDNGRHTVLAIDITVEIEALAENGSVATPVAGTAAGGPVEVCATSSALATSPLELIPLFSSTD